MPDIDDNRWPAAYPRPGPPDPPKKTTTQKVGTWIAIFFAIACLAAILFPVFAQPGIHRHRPSVSSQVRQVCLAAIMYSADYDDRFPLLINGEWRNMQNVGDKKLTSYGAKRTDGWPLLLLEIAKSRQIYIDPTVGDPYGIWQGPALAQGDQGYVGSRTTFRNQNLHPMIGFNYQYLAPLRAPKDLEPGEDPLLRSKGTSRSFNATQDPAATITFAPSQWLDINPKVGFFAINAPGTWGLLSERSDYLAFWSGRACSGGWCSDADADMFGRQPHRGSVRDFVASESSKGADGNTFAFVDGHVAYMKFGKAAAGTDFATVKTNADAQARQRTDGDCVITDKSKYLWNLNDEFIDEAMDVARAARP